MRKKTTIPFRVLVGLDDQRSPNTIKYPFNTLNRGDGFDIFLAKNESAAVVAKRLKAAGDRYARRCMSDMVFEVERHPNCLRVVRRA